MERARMCGVSADGKSSFEVISSSERKRAIFLSAELPTETVNVSRAALKGEMCKACNKADVFIFSFDVSVASAYCNILN